MALAHCILGKFLGVVCHCFPPPLDIRTFAARCLYVRNDARDPSSERWNCGRKSCPVILPKFRLPHKFRDLLHASNLRHGTDGFTSPPNGGRKACWGFFLIYIYIYIGSHSCPELKLFFVFTKSLSSSWFYCMLSWCMLCTDGT